MSQENTQGHSEATWPVNQDYSVKDGRLCATGDEVRRYDPLADEHRVTEFAKLYDGNENAVVEFARRRGLLGWGVIGEPHPEAMVALDTDPISWVWGHARNVRMVLTLYRYLQQKDHDGLTSFLDTNSERALSKIEGEIERASQWPPPMSVPASFGTEEGMIIIMHQHSSLPITFPRGEPAKAAERIIAEIINPNLGHWGMLWVGVQYQVYTDPLHLVFECPYLLAAIYWHLANIVTAGRTVARCQDPTCSALFVVTDRRQRYCPPPAGWKGTTGSQCAAQHRKRRQRQKDGG